MPAPARPPARTGAWAPPGTPRRPRGCGSARHSAADPRASRAAWRSGRGSPGCRARQWRGVEVPDLVDALGELPAFAGALVAVVVDGVVQPLAAVAGAHELLDVGAAGRGVAVQLDRARVRGLHEELPLSLQLLAHRADLIPADQIGGDVG